MNEILLPLYSNLLSDNFITMTLEDKHDLIIAIVEELCEYNNLSNLNKITFNNVDDASGCFNSRTRQININLDGLSQLDGYSCNVLDTIIHEVKHYEQFCNSHDKKIRRGIMGALPSNDKNYIFQKHEKEAYEYTNKQLDKISKKLGNDKLNEYVETRKNNLSKMRKISKSKDASNPLYPLFRQRIIAKRQEEEINFSNVHGHKFVQYDTADIVSKTTISIGAKLDNGYNYPCSLEIKENDNYFEANIKHDNIGAANDGDRILQICATDNNAVIMVSDVDDVSLIEATIKLSETVTDYYNGKNNKNVQRVDVVLNNDISQNNINLLCNRLHMNRIGIDIGLNIGNNIDESLSNSIKRKILDAKQNDMLGFTTDGRNVDASNKMSDEMCMLKIRDLIHKDDKILIHSLREYNTKISSVLEKDLMKETPKYYNKFFEWNKFNIRDLLLEADVIQFMDNDTSKMPVRTLDDKLEDTSIKVVEAKETNKTKSQRIDEDIDR